MALGPEHRGRPTRYHLGGPRPVPHARGAAAPSAGWTLERHRGAREGHPAARTGSSEDGLRAWHPRAKVRRGRMQLRLSAPSGLGSRPAVGRPRGGHELREEPSPSHGHEDTARWGFPDPGLHQSELAGRENHKGHRGPPRPPALSLAPWTTPQRCYVR